MKDEAKKHTQLTLDVLVNILRDENVKDETRVEAAELILRYGWGPLPE